MAIYVGKICKEMSNLYGEEKGTLAVLKIELKSVERLNWRRRYDFERFRMEYEVYFMKGDLLHVMIVINNYFKNS